MDLYIWDVYPRHRCIIHCLGKKRPSFRFKSASCRVMIWGCFSWSDLGTTIHQSSWIYWMTRLSHQCIFSFRVYSRHIPGWQCQDSSGSTCERVEHEDTWVSGSHFNTYFNTWICHHRVLTLKVLGMCWKRLKEEFDSPVINKKSGPKINATLDGNKCDIA